MTDKEFVLSIYPDAHVDSEYLAGYSVFKMEKDSSWTVTRTNDEEKVWHNLRESIEGEMLGKLES
jgi:hypothetical protein